MILQPAIEADATKLFTFIVGEMSATDSRMSPAFLQERIKMGYPRLVYLEEEDKVAAVISGTSIHTEEGSAWMIGLLIVAHDHPDKIKALDALCLYAMNISISEGIHAIYSVDRERDGFIYGRDMLGMAAAQQGTNVRTGKPSGIYWQSGNVEDMMEHILKRRPEWRL